MQFAIWTMLLLRELSFRVRYPIPILADNVAAILIAKSPTHTKYARHIELRTHYIRSVLPFRDFILAYVKSMWNFADLNTKAVTPEIFRRLSSFIPNGIHDFKWKREAEKTLTEIWQQYKARDDSREMEKTCDAIRGDPQRTTSESDSERTASTETRNTTSTKSTFCEPRSS